MKYISDIAMMGNNDFKLGYTTESYVATIKDDSTNEEYKMVGSDIRGKYIYGLCYSFTYLGYDIAGYLDSNILFSSSDIDIKFLSVIDGVDKFCYDNISNVLNKYEMVTIESQMTGFGKLYPLDDLKTDKDIAVSYTKFIYPANDFDTIFVYLNYVGNKIYISLWQMFMDSIDLYKQILDQDYFYYLTNSLEKTLVVQRFKITDKIRNFYTKYKILY